MYNQDQGMQKKKKLKKNKPYYVTYTAKESHTRTNK